MNENRKIICIIGSTKFRKEIKKFAWYLTRVFKFLVLFSPFSKEEIKELEKYRDELELQHFQKIRLSDCIYIFNKNQYMGNSTRKELNYAISLNKLIYSLEEQCYYYNQEKFIHFYPLFKYNKRKVN